MDTALVRALNLVGEGGSFVGSFIAPTLSGGITGHLVGRPFLGGCAQGLVTALFRWSGITRQAHGWITSYSVLAPGRTVCLNPTAIMLCRSLVHLAEFSVPAALNYGYVRYLIHSDKNKNQQAKEDLEEKVFAQIIAQQFLLHQAPSALVPLQFAGAVVLLCNYLCLFGSKTGSTFRD